MIYSLSQSIPLSRSYVIKDVLTSIPKSDLLRATMAARERSATHLAWSGRLLKRKLMKPVQLPAL